MHQDIQIRSPRLPALHKYPLVSQWYDGLKPQVSIIIINYNRAELTIACLQSIRELTEGVKYEVIVLDNGSNDSDYTLLESTSGPCRLIRLEANRYFGEGNNIAVEHAKGLFICLLNNDTIVAEGWLARLVAALSADPKIGAVGPKFIYPDGRLQEAGALVLPDGHVRQIGKGDRAGDLARLSAISGGET